MADSLPALGEVMLGRCWQLIEKETEAMAREEGFDLVVSPRNVFFYRPETDKTGDLPRRISVMGVQTAARETIKDFLAALQQFMRS